MSAGPLRGRGCTRRVRPVARAACRSLRHWPGRWDEEHHIEIAIAQLDGGGSVIVRSELLSCWPYRYDELAAELRQVGLRTEVSTFNLEAENYTVVASKV